MKPSDLAIFLQRMIEARLPVLVPGAPGIGKSDVVEQAAAAAGADLIISHPAVSDPTDYKGLPWIAPDAESATFLPFGDFDRAMKAKKPTVWFFDDLGQAPPSVQAAAMQLFLARRVNDHVLPDFITFVGATNRRTDRAAVSGILEPVKSRFAAIVELEPDIDDWCSWALGKGAMPAELVAFLRFKPELLFDFKPSADLTNSPVPRTWANLGRLFDLDLPNRIRHEAFAGAVGEGAAVEFEAFVQLWKSLPSVDAILLDPDGAEIPDRPATRYAIITALAMRTTEENFGRIARYAERLMEAKAGEFAALLIRDATRRTPEVTATRDFIRLATTELGSLYSGRYVAKEN